MNAASDMEWGITLGQCGGVGGCLPELQLKNGICHNNRGRGLGRGSADVLKVEPY